MRETVFNSVPGGQIKQIFMIREFLTLNSSQQLIIPQFMKDKYHFSHTNVRREVRQNSKLLTVEILEGLSEQMTLELLIDSVYSRNICILLLIFMTVALGIRYFFRLLFSLGLVYL